MKKRICIFVAAAFLFLILPQTVFSALPAAPTVSQISGLTEQTGNICVFSAKSEITSEYEKQRREKYTELSGRYPDEEIAASDLANILYPAGILCEASSDGKNYYPVRLYDPFDAEFEASLTWDILPALAANGAYRNSGFNFTLRFCGAVDAGKDGFIAITEKSDAFEFTCPRSYHIEYILPDGARNNNPSFILYEFEDPLILQNPEKKGFIFEGWKTEDGRYADRVPAGTEHIKLYAVFSPKSYRISYVLTTLEGYSFIHVQNDVNPKKYVCGEETEIYDVTAPRGYVFGGWYEDPEFNGKKTSSIDSGRTGDVILYARWLTEREALDERIAAEHWGDLDDDGKISSYDARLALRNAVGLEELSKEYISRADFAGLGKLNASYARTLLRVAVGLEDMADVLKNYGLI